MYFIVAIKCFFFFILTTALVSGLHLFSKIDGKFYTFLEELHQTLARFNAHGKWEARDVKRGDETRHGPPHYQQTEEPQDRPYVARHDVTIS